MLVRATSAWLVAGRSIEQDPIHGMVDDGHAEYCHRDLGRPHGILNL